MRAYDQGRMEKEEREEEEKEREEAECGIRAIPSLQDRCPCHSPFSTDCHM